MAKGSTRINCLTFNQDCSCLAVGTDTGYKIYTTEPARQCYEKKIEGGMRIVSMLFRTSLLAVVGAGMSHSPRQLQLFNTHDDQNICDISFQDTVLNVKLNKKRLVVILEKCLHVFDLTKMAPLQIIDTEPNPRGIADLSMNEEHSVIAYPKAVVPGCGDVMVVDALGSKNVHVIRAHKSSLSALTLSNCGTKLATSSVKGTVIRVFAISPQGKADAPLLYCLRRGSSPANVYGLAFNANATLLVATSNKQTIHIWKTDTSLHADSSAHSDGPGSIGDTMRNIVQAERAWTTFPSPSPSTHNVVSISKLSSKVYVATMDGHLFQYSLQQGECKRQAEFVLDRPGD